MDFDKGKYKDLFDRGAKDIVAALADGNETIHLTTFKELQEKVQKSSSALKLIDAFDTPRKVRAAIKVFDLPFQIESETDQALPNESWISFNDESAINKREEKSLHHLPENMYKDWERVRDEFESLSGVRLRISSAYRSPAYQLKLVCDCFLREVEARIEEPLVEVFSYAAPPYASKHGTGLVADISNFRRKTGTNPFGLEVKNEAEIYQAELYQDFLPRAGKHGFFQSYPQTNNPNGLEEPWELFWIPSGIDEEKLSIIDFTETLSSDFKVEDYPHLIPDDTDSEYYAPMPEMKRNQFFSVLIRGFFCARGIVKMDKLYSELILRGVLRLESLENFIDMLENAPEHINPAELNLFTDIFNRLKSAHSASAAVSPNSITNGLVGYTPEVLTNRDEYIKDWLQGLRKNYDNNVDLDPEFYTKFNQFTINKIKELPLQI